jgi:ribonuclease HI
MFKVYIDGSCRGNGGPDSVGGIGVAIFQDNKLVGSLALRMFKPATNNEAEYYGLLRALTLVPKTAEVHIYSDSKLVVNQVNGRWKTKEVRLNKLKEKAQELLKQFTDVSLKWLPREKNKEANKLAQAITEDK